MALLMRNVAYTRVMYYWAFNRCMQDVTQKVGGVCFLFEPHICIQEIQEH